MNSEAAIWYQTFLFLSWALAALILEYFNQDTLAGYMITLGMGGLFVMIIGVVAAKLYENKGSK